MATTPWQRLMRTAGRQHQVFTTGQAEDCGIAASTLADMARRRIIVNLGYGVWACGAAPNTYDRKLWVAGLTLGSDVLFTARSVLWLRGIIGAKPQTVDVLTGTDHHLRKRPGVHFCRGTLLDEDESVNLKGHTTTSVYRSFTDAAAVVPLESLIRWLPAMDRLRQGDLDGLEAYSRRRKRYVGVVNLRAAIAILRSDLPHSGAERVARKALRGADLAPYIRPYPVRMGGKTIAEIDLAYPDALYGAEVDGPHHLLPEVAAADKARDRRLAHLGWTIDRFPHEQVLANPPAFVAEVRRGLSGAKSRNAGISNR